MSTEFFLAMNPPTVTHQEHKVAVVNGKPVFYDPPELKAARQKLMAHLGKEVPEEPYTKGLRLVTKWLFPDDGKHGNGTYRITKPDTDNLQKLLKDCMTRVGFWEDDAYWQGMMKELEVLRKNHHHSRLCEDLLCAVVRDLETKSKRSNPAASMKE